MRVMISVLILINSCFANAQPPALVFLGGAGQGYNVATQHSDSNYLAEGGDSDGYALGLVSSQETFLAKGDVGDGYSSAASTALQMYLSLGGDGHGYHTESGQASENYLSVGGAGDGYDLTEVKEKFIWTGAVGTGWNVAGNWNYSEIPDVNRPVVIPAGVPNFPALNAGIFAIGDNPSGGAFVCGRLCILDGAILTARVNSFLENYGVIEIQGEMRIRNVASDALQNMETGTIRIIDSGLLTIKP